MVGKVLQLEEFLRPDQLGTSISHNYVDWQTRRQPKLAQWTELSQYVYATDTTQTTNNKLPWSNKTTIPKLCQIRDNLAANYMASMFPKRKWLLWQGDTPEDEDPSKKKAIESYISWVIERNEFYDEVTKLVLDYIDYGNAFVTVDWQDARIVLKDRQQVGYVGPMIRRISPLDIVFDPLSESFDRTPKIVRTLVSRGEIEEMLTRMSVEDEHVKEDCEALKKYMGTIRNWASQSGDEGIDHKDAIYNIAGFGNFKDYLRSDYCEILTFYGDIYDRHAGEFKRNQVIKVVDRHKILSQRTNTSTFGTAPIYHAGWRVRPDNLWAMGPLDNLVGMQYRIDHLENLKADLFDIITFPPLKVRGYVEDFNWGPMERIYVGDDGDVEMIAPQVQALQANTEIEILQSRMEEMAGSPKEAMGFRTPGEKTKYEVQRLENAASRIFQAKIGQFERALVEPALNALLELSRRNLDAQSIRLWDNEEKLARFTELTQEDITGNGRLKPVAARHFAEQSEMVQNITNFYSSAVGMDPMVRAHISSVAVARFFEQLLDVEAYKIMQPYIRITEQADAQRFQNVNQENLQMEIGQPSGVIPGDPSASQAKGGPTV